MNYEMKSSEQGHCMTFTSFYITLFNCNCFKTILSDRDTPIVTPERLKVIYGHIRQKDYHSLLSA